MNSNLRNSEIEIDSQFNADLFDLDLNDSIYDILNEHDEEIDLKYLKETKINITPQGRTIHHDINSSTLSPLSFSRPKY